MSETHEIVTIGEPLELSGAPRPWVSVKVECSACRYVRFTGAPADAAEKRTSWIGDHLAQHAPARVRERNPYREETGDE